MNKKNTTKKVDTHMNPYQAILLSLSSETQSVTLLKVGTVAKMAAVRIMIEQESERLNIPVFARMNTIVFPIERYCDTEEECKLVYDYVLNHTRNTNVFNAVNDYLHNDHASVKERLQKMIEIEKQNT